MNVPNSIFLRVIFRACTFVSFGIAFALLLRESSSIPQAQFVLGTIALAGTGVGWQIAEEKPPA